jgi:tRNA-dihydrouridine synthase B
MNIGGLRINGQVMLAPMAGFTDTPFRVLCHRYGSVLNFTEMISAKGVVANDPRSLRMTSISMDEGTTAVQLFGDEPETIANAIRMIEENPQGPGTPAMFDLNAGCPVKKVIQKGAGSDLLRKPELLGKIIRTMRNATELPISVKMRLGWDSPDAADFPDVSDWDHVRIARLIEENGADLLIVHGRYRDQKYSGKAHVNRIREIVDAVGIPVVGNGDILDEESAERMLEEAGCSYLMVGRGAQGNPFIFKRLNHFLSSGEKIRQKSKVMLFEEYLDLARGYGIRDPLIKKQSMQFIRGMKDLRAIQAEVKLLTEPDAILNTMRTFEDSGSRLH